MCSHSGARLQAAGCPSYWVVHPGEPSVIVWEQRDGEYVESAHVAGSERFVAASPFAITLVPSALRDPDLPDA